MKKEVWKTILQVIIAVLTAVGTTLGVTSCMQADSSFASSEVKEVKEVITPYGRSGS